MAQINKSSEYFNTVLWTGNSTARDITTGHATDFAWLKVRNATGDHFLFDIIRGTNNYVRSNLTSAEGTLANTLTAFNSDGFSLGNANAVNASGETQVGWSWVAGGTASSNTDGSITSNVSASTTSGFSIVSWTGSGANATVGHGLTSVPKTIIVKNRSTADNWMVYHVGAGSNSYLHLETTNGALSPSTAQFQATTPTSSLFYVGTADGTNKSSSNMIAYCFAEKKGFSKFGLYTGNGNADGTFVYTGFKPAWVMIKRTNTSGDAWVLFDNKRPGYNLIDNFLEADTSGAEAVNNPNQRIDTISNGFKCRGTGGATNVSGSTYIYMAFAENPFVTSTGIPTTAR